MNIQLVTTNKEKQDAFQVRTTVFVHEQNVPPEEELDAYDTEAIHFVGYVEDMPMAASRLRFVGEYGKLERICVIKEYRGSSFGKQLIKEMERTIREKGFRKAKLHAQTHAEAFYQKLGYQTVSEEFIDAGIPHVAMVKELSS